MERWRAHRLPHYIYRGILTRSFWGALRSVIICKDNWVSRRRPNFLTQPTAGGRWSFSVTRKLGVAEAQEEPTVLLARHEDKSKVAVPKGNVLLEIL